MSGPRHFEFAALLLPRRAVTSRAGTPTCPACVSTVAVSPPVDRDARPRVVTPAGRVVGAGDPPPTPVASVASGGAAEADRTEVQ